MKKYLLYLLVMMLVSLFAVGRAVTHLVTILAPFLLYGSIAITTLIVFAYIIILVGAARLSHSAELPKRKATALTHIEILESRYEKWPLQSPEKQ